MQGGKIRVRRSEACGPARWSCSWYKTHHLLTVRRRYCTVTGQLEPGNYQPMLCDPVSPLRLLSSCLVRSSRSALIGFLMTCQNHCPATKTEKVKGAKELENAFEAQKCSTASLQVIGGVVCTTHKEIIGSLRCFTVARSINKRSGHVQPQRLRRCEAL